ncbi:MAG: MBL fold metallo-hydrolase [Opitutaceae bacterium]|nr:MBL fold metallo-hydrolase [Opitutaceae bacterium]
MPPFLRIAVTLGALVFTFAGARSFAAEPAKPGTQVILLGTGTPNAEPARSGPATAIVVNGAVYLVDSGPGIVRRAAAAKLSMPALQHVFFTHLHSDHTLGYPDLIFSPWVLERNAPLEAYGPPGLRAMTDHLRAAWQEDIDMRLDGGEPSNKTGWRVNVHEITAGVVYRDANVTVKAFAVPHGTWKHAFGYRFETADRTIVISGDTTFTPEMIEQARGADVLVHEAYSEVGLKTRALPWQKYHAAFHTSSSDVARIAREAKPKLLVLHHLVLSGQPPEQVLREVTASYTGKVVIGQDLEVY